MRLLQHWRHQQLNGVKRFFYQIEKARKCSIRAKIILNAGIGEDVGRDAYLAAFPCRAGLILARSGRVVERHRDGLFPTALRRDLLEPSKRPNRVGSRHSP